MLETDGFIPGKKKPTADDEERDAAQLAVIQSNVNTPIFNQVIY
jgi:hypothetical protein